MIIMLWTKCFSCLIKTSAGVNENLLVSNSSYNQNSSRDQCGPTNVLYVSDITIFLQLYKYLNHYNLWVWLFIIGFFYTYYNISICTSISWYHVTMFTVHWSLYKGISSENSMYVRNFLHRKIIHIFVTTQEHLT